MNLRQAVIARIPQPIASRLRRLKNAIVTRNAIEETDLIADLAEAEGNGSPEAVLVDVGAHYGAVTARFLQIGWSVVAYEPDPSNREIFIQNIGLNPRVQLSSAAVSDKASESAEFYTSPVSTGISTLKAFHDSHEPTAKVSVVTLAADLRKRGVGRVDFLKIDIEGLDLFALRGFDWNYRPRFVLYEFEDRKTAGLGYRLRDSAAYMSSLDYHLVYSVWEPVVEYGLRHRWRGLYPVQPRDVADCWGNVLCFREEADARACLHKYGPKR